MSDPLEPIEPVLTMIVEDGTGVSGANSYISLSDAVAYQLNNNRQEWLALTDEEKQASLIRATKYIDVTYNWKGRQKFILEQDLEFPRVNLFIKDYEITGIPKRLKEAVCEAAFYGFNEELAVVRKNGTGAIKSESERNKAKADVVEEETEYKYEYFSSDEEKVDYISRFAILDDMLRGLYIPKNSKTITGSTDWNF